MNVVYPLTNKSTLAAFAPVEQKTLREVLAELAGEPAEHYFDTDCVLAIIDYFKMSSSSYKYSLFGFTKEEYDAFISYLDIPVDALVLDYVECIVAHQDSADFKRHALAWVDKNFILWLTKFTAIVTRVKFDENASEQETITENVTRSNKNDQTAQDTLTRNGTNTSTAALSSNSTAKKLSSNFPIVDYTTEGASVDDKYADGSEKTTQESTSNATNNATAEANETRNGTNSETSNGTENRTYTRKKESTNGRTPFELQRAYLDSLTNLTDEIVRSFATLLNGNMYSF